jgi:hypothetical protein
MSLIQQHLREFELYGYFGVISAAAHQLRHEGRLHHAAGFLDGTTEGPSLACDEAAVTWATSLHERPIEAPTCP